MDNQRGGSLSMNKVFDEFAEKSEFVLFPDEVVGQRRVGMKPAELKSRSSTRDKKLGDFVPERSLFVKTAILTSLKMAKMLTVVSALIIVAVACSTATPIGVDNPSFGGGGSGGGRTEVVVPTQSSVATAVVTETASPSAVPTQIIETATPEGPVTPDNVDINILLSMPFPNNYDEILQNMEAGVYPIVPSPETDPIGFDQWVRESSQVLRNIQDVNLLMEADVNAGATVALTTSPGLALGKLKGNVPIVMYKGIAGANIPVMVVNMKSLNGLQFMMYIIDPAGSNMGLNGPDFVANLKNQQRVSSAGLYCDVRDNMPDRQRRIVNNFMKNCWFSRVDDFIVLRGVGGFAMVNTD